MYNDKIKNQEMDTDVGFANWNSFYTDLTTEISEIRKLGYLVLFNPKQVNHYYSKIVNLFSTISWALDETKGNQITKKLDKIEENIFSTKYLNDLKNTHITTYQRYIIKVLRETIKSICLELSNAGLLPKIKRTVKDTRPGTVRNQQ